VYVVICTTCQRNQKHQTYIQSNQERENDIAYRCYNITLEK